MTSKRFDDSAPLPAEIHTRVGFALKHNRVEEFLEDIHNLIFWLPDRLISHFRSHSNNFERSFSLFLYHGINITDLKALKKGDSRPDIKRLSKKLSASMQKFSDEHEILNDILRTESPINIKFKEAGRDLVTLVYKMLANLKKLQAALADKEVDDVRIDARSIIHRGIKECAIQLVKDGKDPIEFWFADEFDDQSESDQSLESVSRGDIGKSDSSSPKSWEDSADASGQESGKRDAYGFDVDTDEFDPQAGLTGRDRDYVTTEIIAKIHKWMREDDSTIDELVDYYVLCKVHNLDLRESNRILASKSGDIKSYLTVILCSKLAHREYKDAVETAAKLLSAFPAGAVEKDASVNIRLSKNLAEVAEFIKNTDLNTLESACLASALVFLKRYDSDVFSRVMVQNEDRLHAILEGARQSIEKQRHASGNPITLASLGYLMMELSPHTT